MGLEVATLAAIGAGIGAVGTIYQMQQSSKAAKNQRRAMEMQQRKQDLAAARERRQQYRQARIQRAQIASAAGATGVGQSSGAISGAGIAGTQAGSNVSFLNAQQGLTQRATQFNIGANKAMQNASMGGAIAGLGMGLFNQAGGFGTLMNSGLGNQASALFGTKYNTTPFSQQSRMLAAQEF